jgi:hypothetical protein
MFRTALITGVVWACVAIVVGLIVGRRLRHRATPSRVERPEFRKGA